MKADSSINIPNHIAIIPDGNRRWARARGLQPWKGHIEGFKIADEIAYSALDAGVQNLTIWGGSYNNLTKRPKTEISSLDRIYKQLAGRVLKNERVYKDGVRIHVLGEWPNLLTKGTVKKLRELENKTKHHKKNNLTFLIGYNGDREMMNAIKSIQKDNPKTISSKIIKSHLWTAELPPVDLVIRTAGEPHLSTGFMMWDIQDAELYFSGKFWPDFTKTDLKKAIKFYSDRDRRFGK